jgi:hypothetical protein
MAKSDDYVNIAKAGAIVGAVALGGYFVYKIINPGAVGGSCTTPGTPCYEATSGYQSQLQVCMNEFTQLNTTIATQVTAPTAGQAAAMNNLTTCMKNAAAGIASASAAFIPPDQVNELVEGAILVAATIAISKYGLPGLAGFINTLRSGGQITTELEDSGSFSSIVANATAWLAQQDDLISSADADAWTSLINNVTDNAVQETTDFYQGLADSGYIAQEIADQTISDLTDSITSDAQTLIDALGGLAASPPYLEPPQVQGCTTCYDESGLNPAISKARGR